MSDIETAIALLIHTFNKYSGREGDKFTLTKAELLLLLKNELGELLGKNKDQAAVDAIFNDLDRNKDNSVDFCEYVTLVCALAQLCHEFFKE